jgi:cellulose synthase (UDP-forming)
MRVFKRGLNRLKKPEVFGGTQRPIASHYETPANRTILYRSNVFNEVEIGGISSRMLRVVLPLYLLMAASYIVWRFMTASEWHVWYSYVLLSAELYSIAFTISFIFTTRRILEPVWQPPIKGATVDIFITTYNEPEEIVKMTLLGALKVHGVRNVFVLNDGNRENIRKLTLKAGGKHVGRYENTHAKAGNMNNGIKHSDAEFMVFLDCDHVPQANFIERTLGYFRDENLAFIQTPQTFYNRDSIQFRRTRRRNYWNEQSMFYESIQPAKNGYNAAFFCGSGSMLRRRAIDEIDGFATGTATEDIHTSLKLHARGWNSLFVSEILAHGIAAEDLNEYHKQRVRWGAGSLGLLFRSVDSPLRARGLSIMQRICYINSTVAFLNGIQRLFYILLPALLLALLPLQHNLAQVPVIQYTAVALPFVIISYMVTYLFSRRTFHPLYTEQFNIANIYSNIMATKGIVNVQKKFKVSLKVRGLKKESSSYRVLLFMFAFTVFGALASPLYWFVRDGKSLQELLHSTVGISMLWNLINMFFVGSVLFFVNFHDEKTRSSHQFRTDLPILLIDNKRRAVQLKRISMRGAEITNEQYTRQKNVEVSIGPDVKQRLTLKAKVVSIEKMKKGQYKTEIIFKKLTFKQEVALTTMMFRHIAPQAFKDEFKGFKILRQVTLRPRTQRMPRRLYAEQDAA